MNVFIATPELQGHPDLLAMLQAMYSRSHMSIKDRLQDLSDNPGNADKIRESLKRYAIAYGHESINDCGDITVFIEGVSMLTAKAIEEHQLFSGQESSTRYIDFAVQPRPAYADAFYDRWMELYQRSLPLLIERFTQDHPEYTDAGAKAAAFDVARGLLPTGVQTQVAWKSSIRVLREHTARLMCHPLQVVRDDAAPVLQALAYRFPDLFGTESQARIKTEYNWFLTGDEYDLGGAVPAVGWRLGNPDYSHAALKLLGTRTVQFGLDYASFRDLQRHRNAYIRTLPLLGSDDSIHVPILSTWYLDRLPDLIKSAALKLRLDMHAWAATNLSRIDELVTSLPMMSIVYGTMTMDIPQLQYMANLRTGRTVHATLRAMMAEEVRDVETAFPNLKGMFTVHEGENDYAKRATQTITKDGAAIT